jgi:hypothetical protein
MRSFFIGGVYRFGGWRLEVGGWRLEVGGWRLEVGGEEPGADSRKPEAWKLEAGS